VLALACDLPAVPESFLAELVRRGERTGADWLLARTERGIEPLAALYGPRALAALEEQVRTGRYAPRELLARTDLRIEVIEGDDLARHGDPEHLFANLNRPEDLETLQ
jgi:molybdopterin-guanine dinucleotide biosynthesis protein A